MILVFTQYCYGSSHKSVPRVLFPLFQAENTLEVFRYIPMISAPQLSHRLQNTTATRRPALHKVTCTTELSKLVGCCWVWIRLFRPVRAIAEPWDEGDGIEWAKMAVDRVTRQWLCGLPTPALCRGRLPSHWRPPLPGGGSRAATYPVADSHQARVNDGRTEERGPVIQRINRDLTVEAGGRLLI